ncbi:hypothetical protein P9112_011274 [Eukaryota sp. TZLM1-RC]
MSGFEDASTRKSRALIIMMCLIGSYFFIEIGVGIYINSLALISDALHSLSDMVALAVGLICVRMAKRERCSKYTYGWHRAEVMGGLANGILLLIIVFFIFFEGIHRLIEFQEVEDPIIMTITASIGLCLNLFGLYLFGHQHHGGGQCSHSHEEVLLDKASSEHHDHDHDHDHDHGHGHGHDVNMRGVFLHILGDALGSIAVLLSGLFMNFSNLKYAHLADPIASMVFAIIIFCASAPLVWKCMKILVQSTPSHISVSHLSTKIRELPGIQGLHDFHIWQLSSSTIIASIHINISRKADFDSLAKSIVQILHRAGVHETTIQPCFVDESLIESEHVSCPVDTCVTCDPPEEEKEEEIDVVVE